MARTSNSRLALIFALLFGSAAIATCEASGVPFRYYHVEFKNQLSRQILNVHCNSGDGDLAVSIMQPGEKFVWDFRMTQFFTTTLFTCKVWSDFGQSSFEVSKASNPLVYDWCLANACQLRGKESGIDVYNGKTGAWGYKYTWNKK